MKNSPLITVSVDGHVARIDLDHQPGDFDDVFQLLAELSETCEQIAAADHIRVVTVHIVGRPMRFFTADPGAISARLEQIPTEEHRCGADMLAALPQPVIAGLGGDIFGLGLEAALACDLRIAADTTHFAMDHLAAGEIPYWGGTQRLARLIGKGHALHLLLTGDAIDAREALRIGLINRLAPADRLEAVIGEVAAKLASKGPIALRYLKEAVCQGVDMSLEQGLRLEADLYFLLHTSKDRTEGIHAFQQKRGAKFEGR
jgi:enoyl-CoA hydratase